MNHPRTCSTCFGSGAAPGTTPRSCEACGGSGQKTETREQANLRVQTIATCATCNGRGHFIDRPCSTCGGSGREAEAETLTVRIPVGVEEGMVLRIPGKGMPTPVAGGKPGDLYVTVHSQPDTRFARRGADLWREEPISVTDAVLGAELSVPTLEGSARLDIPVGTQPDTVLRLRGKGLPGFEGAGRGDLYVAVRVRVPEKLSREERKLWKRLRALAANHNRT